MKAQYAILRFAKYKGSEISNIEAHNERTKEIIYPKEAETVKEIFRLYTEEGQSISYIAKKLNDENIQREQRGNVKISGFTDRTVRIILSNPVYAGMISYGRRHTVKVEGKNNETKVVKQDDESKIILVDGVHEPIVSKETFAKAAERLKKNVAHRKTRSDSTTVYPLTGLIRCPDCGKNIFGYTAPPRKKKNGKEGYYPRYISYRCISGRDRNGISCSLANKYYSGTKLETEVKEVISSMVTIPEFACHDNLKGLGDAINAVFSEAKQQLCIVHQVRNSAKFVPWKDRKAVCADLKKIYSAVNLDAAEYAKEEFREKWDQKYPSILRSWDTNWAELTTFFAYPEQIRHLIYTTNGVEAYHRMVRKFTKAKAIFPTDDSIRKVVYLSVKEITKKWTMPVRDWGLCYSQIMAFFADRFAA